jgi:hypothetical protein
VIGILLIGRTGVITFQSVGKVKTMLSFVFWLVMSSGRHESEMLLLKKILGSLCR